MDPPWPRGVQKLAASNVCLWRTFGKYTRVSSQVHRPSCTTNWYVWSLSVPLRIKLHSRPSTKRNTMPSPVDIQSSNIVVHVKHSVKLPMSIAVGCVVLDALTAYPQFRAEDTGATSMRMTAFVLIICTGAPVIGQQYAALQIYVLAG